MSDQNIIEGKSEEELFVQIDKQFSEVPELFEYSAIILHNERQIRLGIDIDPGGGFESGFETTVFSSAFLFPPSFRFAIHEEHFTDEIGKFFGMEDVKIGYDELDRKLIIKTDDKAKVRKLFSDISLRVYFQNLKDFSLGIIKHSENGEAKSFLELTIERGITDTSELRKIYHSFYIVLMSLDVE